MRVFWKLGVGLRAHALTLEAYDETRTFPEDERFGLTAQIRRAAYSIPANIAEGCGRRTDGDFARFVDIALGSASELEYLRFLARDLGYLEPARHQRLHDHILDVKRMLHGLAVAVRGQVAGRRAARGLAGSRSGFPARRVGGARGLFLAGNLMVSLGRNR